MNTLTYKFAILNLTTNKFTVKHFLCFTEKITDQRPGLLTYRLRRPLKFAQMNLKLKSSSKCEFKELLSFTIKDAHFIFDEKLYKQIDGKTIDSPLRSYIS